MDSRASPLIRYRAGRWERYHPGYRQSEGYEIANFRPEPVPLSEQEQEQADAIEAFARKDR